jgi:DNA-binding LacI/PurR family transcriptional regulator
MSQHHLLDSDIHLASFDDHYLYDSLSLRIDTVQQDNRQLAWHCYDLISQLIDGNTPAATALPAGDAAVSASVIHASSPAIRTR